MRKTEYTLDTCARFDANADGILQLTELTLNNDVIVLADGDIVGVSTGFNAVCHMLRCVADTAILRRWCCRRAPALRPRRSRTS